jgi:hypothetical protein
MYEWHRARGIQDHRGRSRRDENGRDYVRWCSIQYVEHTEGDGREMFQAICKLGLEGIVSKKLSSVRRRGQAAD